MAQQWREDIEYLCLDVWWENDWENGYTVSHTHLCYYQSREFGV